MGQIYEAKCFSCGHGFKFSRGCSMFDCTAHGRKEHKEKILGGMFGVTLKDVAKKHPDAIISYSQELFYCESCNKYQNLARYKIYDSAPGKEGDLLAISNYACKLCYKPLQIIGDNAYSFTPNWLVCPHCKELARVELEMLFD